MTNLLIISNIVGYIGLVLLYIQVVFGSRHIFSLFTKDTVLVNKLHSIIGRYSIFAIFFHPLLSMMDRLKDIWWLFIPSFIVETETHITFGRFAFILFLVVFITSALVREKLKWHPWKLVHLLAYPIVFLGFMHFREIGTFYNQFSTIRFFWAFFFFIFIISVVYRLAVWGGFKKQKYTLQSKTLVGTDIVLLELKPIAGIIRSIIGQHFFLQAVRFGSEHPFTIIRNNSGTLSFGIRKVGKFWDEIQKKNIGDVVLVDGPYGVFTKEAQNSNPKVIISAGVGVTPFVDLVEHFGENAIYINCNRSLDEVIERDILKSKSTKYVDVVEKYEGLPQDGVYVGRITPEIIKNTVGENITNLPFFVCGSPIFIKIIKKILSDAGVSAKQVYFEELGF